MSDFDQILNAYRRNMFAGEGEATDVLALYQALPDKHVTDDSGKNLYHIAASFLDFKAIAYLLAEGVKPIQDNYGNTPLHALATGPFTNDISNYEKKAEEIYQTAQELLNAKVNPKKKNDSGQIAYYQAGISTIYPFIRAMADNNVKMDAVGEENKNIIHAICDKLYHRKSVKGQPEAAYQTIKALLESGSIDPEDTDVFGNTPLKYAQKSEVKEIAALLSGEENAVKTGGMTLAEAVLQKDMEALTALIEMGADINEATENQRTPLMLACEYPSLEIVQLLTKKGANSNFKSGETGHTAVYYLLNDAIRNLGRGVAGGQDVKTIVKILRCLIDSGLEVDAFIDNSGNTALNLLCSMSYMGGINNPMAEELIDAGCDVNLTNYAGQTPLMTFARGGNEPEHNIAELLLDKGAATAPADKSSNTALMYAAGNPDKMSAKKIVELLLDAGDETIEKSNNAGETALDIAVKSENEAVVKKLLAKLS